LTRIPDVSFANVLRCYSYGSIMRWCHALMLCAGAMSSLHKTLSERMTRQAVRQALGRNYYCVAFISYLEDHFSPIPKDWRSDSIIGNALVEDLGHLDE